MRSIGDVRAIGLAGEHRVASELLLRGHNPSIAIIDRGVDMILGDGTTIQVKTTTQLGQQKRGYYVTVDISSTSYTMARRGADPTDLRADYFIVWIVPRNEFYIIPRDAIIARNVKHSLSIAPNSGQGFATYKDRWDLLKED